MWCFSQTRVFFIAYFWNRREENDLFTGTKGTQKPKNIVVIAQLDSRVSIQGVCYAKFKTVALRTCDLWGSPKLFWVNTLIITENCYIFLIFEAPKTIRHKKFLNRHWLPHIILYRLKTFFVLYWTFKYSDRFSIVSVRFDRRTLFYWVIKGMFIQ